MLYMILDFFCQESICWKSPVLTWCFGNWHKGANEAAEHVMGFVNPERLKKPSCSRLLIIKSFLIWVNLASRFPKNMFYAVIFFHGRNYKIYL